MRTRRMLALLLPLFIAGCAERPTVLPPYAFLKGAEFVRKSVDGTTKIYNVHRSFESEIALVKKECTVAKGWDLAESAPGKPKVGVLTGEPGKYLIQPGQADAASRTTLPGTDADWVTISLNGL